MLTAWLSASRRHWEPNWRGGGLGNVVDGWCMSVSDGGNTPNEWPRALLDPLCYLRVPVQHEMYVLFIHADYILYMSRVANPEVRRCGGRLWWHRTTEEHLTPASGREMCTALSRYLSMHPRRPLSVQLAHETRCNSRSCPNITCYSFYSASQSPHATGRRGTRLSPSPSPHAHSDHDPLNTPEPTDAAAQEGTHQSAL